MSRVGVLELLAADATLNSMGINGDRIWPNFALDGAPRDGGLWLVLRWGSRPGRWGGVGGKQSLTVWAYQGRQVSNDFTAILAVLDRVTGVLAGVSNHVASDGSVVTTVDYGGESEDLVDEGYDAIAKSVQFTVVTREA